MARLRRDYEPRQSLFCVRFFILLLLCAVSAGSMYFYDQLAALNGQVQTEESVISSLQTHIQAQQLIIDRFNQSVTNADVQNKVEDLEKSLQQTEQKMIQSLDQTTIQIQTLLNATVQKLDTTVKAAQAEIQNEVNIVKGDVEQYVRTTQDQFSMENSFMVYQLAGTFTLLAVLISMWHMTGHVRKFRRPHVQRKIMAILWMSPIYGVTSWLSLVFPNYEGYLAIIKDFYEAYVIYQFLSFLISVLGFGDRSKVVDLLTKHADHLEPPMRFFGWCRGPFDYGSDRALADAVLMQCQAFTMQFVFFKPITAVGTFTCNKLQYFGLGTSSGDYRSPQFWFNIIQNGSIFLAFSGLLKFYHAVQAELGWCRPFPKFLCIKGIVFMTFWQGLVISILANSTNIAGNKNQEGESDIWGKQAQNFLICLEMLLFSIAHFYCFPTEEWEEGYRPAVEKKMSAGDNLAFGDFVADLKLIVRGNDTGLKKRKKDKSTKKLDDTYTDASPLVDEIGDNDIVEKIGDEEEGDSGLGSETEDLDTSLDMDQLQSSIRNSVQEAILDPDEGIRDAASRLLPLMDRIGEEDDIVNCEDLDESHELDDEVFIEEPFGGSHSEEDEDAPLLNTEEFPQTSLPDSGYGYGALSDNEGQNAEVSEDDDIVNDDGDEVAPNEEFLQTSSPESGYGYGALSDNEGQNAEVFEDGDIVNDDGDEVAPNETTSLLGGNVSDKPDVQLRPSIFTTQL